MMKATNRNVWIALLVGAVLLAAAIGAAVLFRANDTEHAAQTDAPTAGSSAEPAKESGAQEDAQEEETPEISPRLAKLLQMLYDHRGPVSNPKIREWLEWYGNKLIVEGEEDGDIVGALDSSLWDLREIADPKELERRIEDSRENALYDYEEEDEDDEGLQYSENFSEKKNRIQRFLYDLYGHLRYPGPDSPAPRRLHRLSHRFSPAAHQARSGPSRERGLRIPQRTLLHYANLFEELREKASLHPARLRSSSLRRPDRSFLRPECRSPRRGVFSSGPG